MTFCHACGERMTLDQWRHPVHPELCSGPPRVHPVECPWCGDVFDTAHSLRQHHRRCTRDDPTHRDRARDNNACERCQLRHTPRCTQTVWPLQPLIAAVGSSRLYEVLDVERTQVRRLEITGLPTYQADRWATAFELHPAQVWGWAWFADALPAWHDENEVGGWRQAWEWTEQQTVNEQTQIGSDKEKAA